MKRSLMLEIVDLDQEVDQSVAQIRKLSTTTRE